MSELMEKIVEAVDYQAKDEALWLKTDSIEVAYLQQAIRDLHNVIEQTDDNALQRIKDCSSCSSGK